MYLRTLEICVLKYVNLILSIYFSAPALARQAALKKTKVKSDLLPDISMLSIVEKGGICHSIYRHAKGDNNCMKHYHKNRKSSYIQYWDVSWAMQQKLSVNSFEWIKDTSQYNEDFIKNYNEESDEGYF